MISSTYKNIKYYSFPEISQYGLNHAIFTRLGGVSKGNFESLNLGGSLGDDPDNVLENHKRVFEAVNRDLDSRFQVWQVHGTQIVCNEKIHTNQENFIKADGIFTSNRKLTLIMRFADCVPLLFFDPIKRVVGIVHAGWQGTLAKVGQEAITEIQNYYGSQPENLIVGIGPSICGKCFEVGSDVAERFENLFEESSKSVIWRDNQKSFIDLWSANEILLRKCGVRKIIRSEICTAHNTEEWYSYRTERGKTGRFGVLMWL